MTHSHTPCIGDSVREVFLGVVSTLRVELILLLRVVVRTVMEPATCEESWDLLGQLLLSREG